MKIDKETSVVLAAPQKGQYYLNLEQVTPDAIQDRITAIIKDKPLEERVVYIKSDKAVSYGTVVSLINAIRSAGCDRIGLVSEKGTGPTQVRRNRQAAPEGGR